jgi:hypothetical protein
MPQTPTKEVATHASLPHLTGNSAMFLRAYQI